MVISGSPDAKVITTGRGSARGDRAGGTGTLPAFGHRLVADKDDEERGEQAESDQAGQEPAGGK